jgi:hypothetical protein
VVNLHCHKYSSSLSIINLEFLRASEGTLSRWYRLYLQSLAPTSVSSRVDIRQPVVKIIAVFYHNMMKNMLYQPYLVWEKGRKKKYSSSIIILQLMIAF